MKTKFTFEVLALAGLVAGLAVTTGCRTTYSGNNNDLSLSPMPESLNPEPVGDVKFPTAEEAKPLPYWKANPEAVASLDKVAVSGGKLPGNASFSSYTVKAGDSLGKIAQANGIRLADLKAANPNIDPNKIKVGQTIVIPSGSAVKPVTQKAPASTVKSTGAAAAGGTYVVKQGDILGRIAIANGVKVADLKKANNLTSDKIKVGQKLVIPGKGAKAPAATTVKHGQVKAVAPVTPQVKPVTSAVPVAPAPVEVTPPVVEPVAVPAPVAPTPVPPAPVVDAPVAPVVAPAQPVVAVPPVAPAPQGTPYTVTEGQDLFDIAVKWSVSADEIKRLNNLTSDEVHPGQTLIIPFR